MNEELFFILSGVALLSGVFASILVWALLLKYDEISRRVKIALDVINDQQGKIDNLTAVHLSLDKGIILFAQKLYQQEEALGSLKSDLVTQRQVQALVQEALREVAN